MKVLSMFDGNLGKYLLPGIVLQSVMIGGGYATGREIVEYGAKFGAMGWLSGLATFVGFALVAILSFELIRLYKVYDFKSFLKELIGPLYHVFDLVYLLFMVIIGGLGSLEGAILGSIIVGLLDAYGRWLLPEFSYFVLFGPMAVLLLFRVTGIFGKEH